MSTAKASAPQRILFVGAHPDDAEFSAGGLLQRAARAGHQVMLVSLTDGRAGHQQMPAAELAARRREEAAAAAAHLAARLEIWSQRDGELEPTLALRQQLIGTIRRFEPDLLITHRPADYHPDHRATAQLVQDACYLLQVPNVVPAIAPLTHVPPVLLAWDRFTYPRPFRADWVLDTGPVLDDVVKMLDCHVSQVYEWLPHTQGLTVPLNDRLSWLHDWYARRPRHIAREYAAAHGLERVDYAEAYEVSEYGGPFDANRFDFTLA